MINFRKWICKSLKPPKGSWLYQAADCQRYGPKTISISICSVSRKKPGPYCTATQQIEIQEGETLPDCDVCKKPEEKMMEDTKKPDWMPRMVCAVLSIHYLFRMFEKERVRVFAEKLGLAGVDYLRIMNDSWERDGWDTKGTQPFLKSGDLFDLDKENKEFDDNLKTLKKILKPYHVRIYYDLFDNCSSDQGPFCRNKNGVRGIYDCCLEAIQYFKRWIDRIAGCLDPEEDIIGLGNELHYPEEKDHDKLVDFSKKWVLELGEYLYHKGVRLPLPFSASGEPGEDSTAHKIHGFLSPDVSEVFSMTDSCYVLHGLGLPEDFIEVLPGKKEAWKDCLSGQRSFGYSDDGVGTGALIPPEKRGRCTNEGLACVAKNAWRIKIIREFWLKFGDYLKFIEFLPREICSGESPDLIEPESLVIYSELAKELWNLDIRRYYKA